MTQQNTEILHERASSSYRAGDYLEALAAWRMLLDLDPGDDQAREGVRLCELLAVSTLEEEEESGEIGAIFGDDGLAPVSRAAAVDPNSVFAELSDELLDARSTAAGSPAAGLAARPVTPVGAGDDIDLGFDFNEDEAPAADPTLDEGFDFLDSAVDTVTVPDPSTIEDSFRDTLSELDAAVAVDSSPISDWSDDSLGTEDLVEIRSDDPKATEVLIPNASAQTPKPGAAAIAAATELRRRVNELLAEALAHLERGERKDALVLLDRVLILDDTQETAATLRERIRRELEPPVPDVRDGGDLDRPKPGAVPFRTPAPFGASAKSVTLPELPPESPALDQPALPAARAGWIGRFTLPKELVRSSRRIKLYAAAGIGTTAIGVGLWIAIGGVSGEARETAPHVVSDAPGSKTELARQEPREASPNAEPNAAPVSTTTGTQPQAVQETLKRAEAAAAAEDWAGSVLAYDQALKLDPENTLIRERLLAVGQRFEADRAVKNQWNEARSAFENADYRTSLALLYRLPRVGPDSSNIEAYIIAGWFNMGLIALREGSCREASEALNEAAALRPADAAIQSASRLARSCPVERASTSYQIAVGALNPLPMPAPPADKLAKS